MCYECGLQVNKSKHFYSAHNTFAAFFYIFIKGVVVLSLVLF